MRVLVRSMVRKLRIDAAAVSGFCRAAMRRAGIGRDAELSVLLVGERRMRRLNRDYRRSDSDTDVLAFPTDAQPGSDVLGDVVISIDRACRCSRFLGVTLEEELARYLVHGILHLRGHDDSTRARKERMWRKQEEILRAALRCKRGRLIRNPRRASPHQLRSRGGRRYGTA